MKPELESHRFSRYYTSLEPFLGKPRVRAYTMLILSLLTMSFFGYFAIRPTLTTIATLRRQIADAHFVDAKLQEKINALSQAQLEYEKIKPDLQVVLTALPEESEFPLFVKNLERVASESGTKITNLSFQPVNLSSPEATSQAKEESLGFSLTLGGDYLSLANFVRQLASFERLITVSKMELSTKGGELSLTLGGQAYHVNQ